MSHIIKQAIQNSQDIATLQESVKAVNKRIEENKRITDGIYKLAANVESLAVEVKMLTGRMDDSIARMEAGLKSQGERIGALEKEPATKWKELTKQVIALIVAAVVGAIIMKFV